MFNPRLLPEHFLEARPKTGPDCLKCAAFARQRDTRKGTHYRGTSRIRNSPRLDLTVGLYLGSYVGPGGGGSFL